MDKIITIALSRADISQIMDALEIRLEMWKNTVLYEEGQLLDSSIVEIEECSGVDEAKAIAATYEDIIRKISSQINTI